MLLLALIKHSTPFDILWPHPTASAAKSMHPSTAMPNALRSSLKHCHHDFSGRVRPSSGLDLQLAMQQALRNCVLTRGLPFIGGSQQTSTTDGGPWS